MKLIKLQKEERGPKGYQLSVILWIKLINKARSEEDLKSCLEMKFQLFNSDEGSAMIQLTVTDNETHKNQIAPQINTFLLLSM